MRYTLEIEGPDDLTVEGIARALEAATRQVRMMSSARAAHSMSTTSLGGEVAIRHGVVDRTSGSGTRG